MKMSLVRMLSAVCALCIIIGVPQTFAADMPSLPGGQTVKNKNDLLGKVDAGADVYEYVGDNVIARGHVVIKTGDFKITAERAIININNQDLEASGNVTFTQREVKERLVDMEEFQELLNDFTKQVEILGYTTSPTGAKRVRVKVGTTRSYVKADRITGNLNSGLFQFRDFALKTGALYAAASFAERRTNGKIDVKNARMTTCEYIMDDHDHYAITASSATLTPRDYNRGLQNYNPDHSEHSVIAYNTKLKLWDIPVLWLPALYKPMETDSFGVDYALGRDSNWGFWVRLTKGFTVMQDPYINIAGIADYYSDRGFGWGGTASIKTENSRTEFFGYYIHDRKPFNSWDMDTSDSSSWYANNSRFKIPKDRYEIKLSNVTHITPRLDFRGQFDWMSDPNFLYDFFENRYDENVQPPTYAALEYQFDRASFSVLTTTRINDFYTTLDRLPEGHLDFHRQELFKGLYYQGENSAAYLDMKWRRYDKHALNGEKLNDYSSGRFDSLHFLYYPINLDFINIIPRAGFRMTAYTATSSRDVSDEQLYDMFGFDNIDSGLYGTARNKRLHQFEESNHAKLRLMAEFGVEANTKIYRSWNNVRSSWLALDGLRHVIVPYINYTYIMPPNLDPDEILYFDDIDRLKKQNFMRFGMINRLQTRRGNYGSEQIEEWFSIENYWDFHMEKSQGFNHVGDLGTKIRFTPIKDLTLTSELLIDIGGNNDHDTEAERAHGREAGRVGLSALKYINKWNTTLEYKITKDWKIKASYIYSDDYRQRSTYSMGSLIDSLNTSTSSLTGYYSPTQWLTFDLSFPTYIDPKLKGGIFCQYDVNGAILKDIGFRLIRNFHCFNLGMEAGQKSSRDAEGDKAYSYYIGGFISLSAMPNARLSLRSGL